MTMPRLPLMLALLSSLSILSITPAFSVEEIEIKAGVTTLNDDPMTREAARKMLKSDHLGEDVRATISSPADGSIVKAMTRNKLEYQARGADAYHAHLYIDGNKPVFLRKPVGTHRVAKLSVGDHELCVKVLNKSHKEIGTASCIKVIAQ